MEGGEVDTQVFGHTGTEAFDKHIGAPRQVQEKLAVRAALEVEDRAALAAIPHPVSGLMPDGVAAGRLEFRDLGAVIAKQHPRHRARDPP